MTPQERNARERALTYAVAVVCVAWAAATDPMAKWTLRRVHNHLLDQLATNQELVDERVARFLATMKAAQ